MIHDARVEVTCDQCSDSIEVSPPYVYMTRGGAGGHYDTEDDTINRLVRDEGWIADEGKHYCSEECQEAGS